MMSDHEIGVQGLRIHYVEEGEGKALVYLHGNTGSSLWFSRVMKVPGYRTIAPDMPNFGKSSPLGGAVDLHRYAESVYGLFEALGIAEAVVVGHSLGGAVAQSLALRHPERVSALVLVDSSSPAGLLTPRERYPFIEMMRADRGLLSKALAATVPTLRDQDFFGKLVEDAARMAPEAWLGNAEALAQFDVSGLTASFDKPVLVLRGGSDFIITETMAEDTARAYPKGNFLPLEGVGHSVIVEDPPRFLELLAGFLPK